MTINRRSGLRRWTALAALVAVVASIAFVAPRAEAQETVWWRVPDVPTSVRTIRVGPGESLQAAFDAAQPGDTIRLLPGTHVAEGDLVLNANGRPDAWIRVVSAAGDNRATIDLANLGELRISASYVEVVGVEIINGNGNGNNLHIAPDGPDDDSISHVIVRRVSSHDVATGPGAAIKVNRFGPAAVEYIWLLADDVARPKRHAIIDGVAATHVVAARNRIHDNDPGEPAIFFKGGSQFVFASSPT